MTAQPRGILAVTLVLALQRTLEVARDVLFDLAPLFLEHKFVELGFGGLVGEESTLWRKAGRGRCVWVQVDVGTRRYNEESCRKLELLEGRYRQVRMDAGLLVRRVQ